MLKEALEYLTDLSRVSAAPVKLDASDARRLLYLRGDGAVQSIERDAPAREHEVKQLSDLIRLATRFDGEGDTVGSVVWYDESAIVLVINDGGYRDDSATLDLEESDLFATVRKLAGSSFDHKSFIRLLRVQLAGAIAPSALLDIVRRVKFENGTTVQASVQRSRESLGREITAAVSAEGEIPDAVVLYVPVYKTLGEAETYPLRCSVEVDPIEGRFRLTPYPDEIERVQQLAVGSIAERLADGLPESVPAYYGKP